MENKTTKSGVVSKLWSNWINLDPQQRNAVAQNLGPMGQVLTIAANVHLFVSATQHNVDPNRNRPERASDSNSSRPDTDDDSDIIDVEYVEEVDT